MRYFLTTLCAIALSLSTLFAAKTDKRTIVFDVELHCDACIKKIEKNIAFEKGVKDLICDLDKKQVTIVYDANKTDIGTLQEAFKAIGKPATVNTAATEALTQSKTNASATSPAKEQKLNTQTETDADSGASIPQSE